MGIKSTRLILKLERLYSLPQLCSNDLCPKAQAAYSGLLRVDSFEVSSQVGMNILHQLPSPSESANISAAVTRFRFAPGPAAAVDVDVALLPLGPFDGCP